MAFDFEIILAVAFFVTAIVWAYDRIKFRPKRLAILNGLSDEAAAAIPKLAKEGLVKITQQAAFSTIYLQASNTE